MSKLWTLLTTLILIATPALAADTVLTWPATGNEVILKFTIGKLRIINSYSGQADYAGEATAENLSKKAIPFASFYLYLSDKNRKRIGEGYLELSNLAAGQQAKIPVSAHAIGSIASMELQPQHLPSDEPVKVKMSVTSVPTGASLKVDAQDSGVTPQILSLAPGKHILEFGKEGYETERTPIEVAAGALPGSISLELNPIALDTVVLRDATVVLGDVTSVTTAAVTITVKGKVRKLNRNQVARIVFVERQPAKKAPEKRIGTRKPVSGR